MNYLQQASDDAWEMADNFLDEIIEQASEGEVSNDLFNDYQDGDSYHHENITDKSYNLQQAAELLEQLSDHEETDYGLWHGQQPRDAISTQAAYTYGNAVMYYWNKIIEQINNLIESTEFDSDEDRAVTVTKYITILVMLNSRFEGTDCDGMVQAVLDDIERLEWTSSLVLADWLDEHDKHTIASQLREVASSSCTS